MLGYSILNSKVHDFCLRGIINCFLKRSLFFLYPVYLRADIANTEIIKNSVFNTFIKEELKLSPIIFSTIDEQNNFIKFLTDDNTSVAIKNFEFLIFKENKDNNSTNSITYYNEIGDKKIYIISDDVKTIDRIPNNIVKYLFTANLIKDNNYNFLQKDDNVILSEGKQNLKTIFIEVYNTFIKNHKKIGDVYEKDLNSFLNNTKVTDPKNGIGIIPLSSEITEVVARFLLVEEYYIKHLDDIIKFYKKIEVVKKNPKDADTERDVFLNLLNQQINALTETKVDILTLQ